MFASELISSAVPTLSPTDRAGRAVELMNAFHTDSLPMVRDNDYLGLMEESYLTQTDTDTPLSDVSPAILKPAIHEDAHFFEALKVVGNYGLSILPVLDKTMHYAGAITTHSLIDTFSRFNDFNQEGGLLVLEMNLSDYMLSEIARIAESQEVTLLGVHTITEPGSNSLKVLLKTNRSSLDGLVTSLQQLGYDIIYRFDKAGNTEGLQKNYENLMNYINM